MRLSIFGFDDRDFPRSDFTQRRHYFLVVRIDQRTRALKQLLGSPRRAQYEFESVRDILETVFYSYSSHCLLILRPAAKVVNEPGQAQFPGQSSAVIDMANPPSLPAGGRHTSTPRKRPKRSGPRTLKRSATSSGRWPSSRRCRNYGNSIHQFFGDLSLEKILSLAAIAAGYVTTVGIQGIMNDRKASRECSISLEE
jgi:hypothetical protein